MQHCVMLRVNKAKFTQYCNFFYLTTLYTTFKIKLPWLNKAYQSTKKHISNTFLSGSDGQPKDTDDTVHGLVLPSHCTTTISRVVPEACTSCLQTCTVFLHDDAGYYVFERFSEFAELAEALLHNTSGPLIHSAVLVCISSNCSFY